MIGGLLEKEFRQHGLALLSVFLLVVAGLGVILQNRFLHEAFGSAFAAMRFLLLSFVPLAGLVLGQVLIVGEYRHKTQLFLEGLPLERWRMIAIKYGMGLVLMLGAVAVVLAVAWQKSRLTDAVTPRFLFLLALRSACFVWFLWSLCFAHGFMGRYRFLFAIAAIVVIRMSVIVYNIDFGAHGPFELAGDHFAYERYELPAWELAVTAAYALFWTAAGFALGLARDATIAASFSQRMSPREKMVLTFGVFALLMALATQAERSTNSEPIHLPGAVDVARGKVRVSAAAAVDHPTSKENAALRRAAEGAAAELAEVAGFLNCDLPPLFIIHRRDLKPNVFENANIEKKQGLMVRANLTAAEFKSDALMRWILREILVAKSLGRLNLERTAWILDGFPEWWFTRQAPPGADADEARGALEAMPRDFSRRDLDRWLTLRPGPGEGKTRKLAAFGLRVLDSKHGDEACRRFLASVLGRPATKDARPWLYDLARPVPSRFRAATGVSLDAFIEEWREAVAHIVAVNPQAVAQP